MGTAAGTHLAPKGVLTGVLGRGRQAAFPNAPPPLLAFRLLSLGRHLQKSTGNSMRSPVPDPTIPTPKPGPGRPIIGAALELLPKLGSQVSPGSQLRGGPPRSQVLPGSQMSGGRRARWSPAAPVRGARRRRRRRRPGGALVSAFGHAWPGAPSAGTSQRFRANLRVAAGPD